MKLPAIELARQPQLKTAGYGVIQQEQQATQGLIQAATNVAGQYIQAESNAEFITAKATAKRETNALHRKISQPTIAVKDLGGIAYNPKDEKDGFVPTYTVADKMWEQETDRIYTSATSSMKHQASTNEFNARWADGKEVSREVMFKQKELGAKSFLLGEKEVEKQQAYLDKDFGTVREINHLLVQEGAYSPKQGAAETAKLNKVMESSNVYDMINRQDVDSMESEKKRLQDKESKYSGPHDERERKALIAELNAGINNANALAGSMNQEVVKGANDYMSALNRFGAKTELDPVYRASVEAMETTTPAQGAAKTRLLREIDVTESAHGKRSELMTSNDKGAAKVIEQQRKEIAKIKDNVARAAANNAFNQAVAYRESMLNTDPAAFAVQSSPDVEASFDDFQSAFFSGDLVAANQLYSEYRAQSSSAQASYSNRDSKVFPNSFASSFAKQMEGATVQDKTRMAKAFVAIGGSDIIQIANEIGGENAAFTAGMILIDDNEKLATDIFRGMEVPDPYAPKLWKEVQTNILFGSNISYEDQTNIMSAIQAGYLGTIDKDMMLDGTEINDENLQRVVAEVLGPRVEPGGNRTKAVYSYQGTDGNYRSPGQFNDTLDLVDDSNFMKSQGVSIRVGGTTNPSEIIENADLIPAPGNGQYYLAVQNSTPTEAGGTNYVTDTGYVKGSDGQIFILDMPALEREQERQKYMLVPGQDL